MSTADKSNQPHPLQNGSRSSADGVQGEEMNKGESLHAPATPAYQRMADSKARHRPAKLPPAQRKPLSAPDTVHVKQLAAYQRMANAATGNMPQAKAQPRPGATAQLVQATSSAHSYTQYYQATDVAQLHAQYMNHSPITGVSNAFARATGASPAIQRVKDSGELEANDYDTIDEWFAKELKGIDAEGTVFAAGSYGRMEMHKDSDMDIHMKDKEGFGKLSSAVDARGDKLRDILSNPTIENESQNGRGAVGPWGSFRKIYGDGDEDDVTQRNAGVIFKDLGNENYNTVKDNINTALREGGVNVLKAAMYQKLYAFVQGASFEYGVPSNVTNYVPRIVEINASATKQGHRTQLLDPLKTVYDNVQAIRIKQAFDKNDKNSVDDDRARNVMFSVLANSKAYQAGEDGLFTLRQAPQPEVGCACFITTACVRAMGLPDDCMELTMLRAYRDNYLARKYSGQELINLYYELSPRIVEAIDRQSDREGIYARLYQVISNCTRCIRRKEDEDAFRLYVTMLMVLKDLYTPEMEMPPYVQTLTDRMNIYAA